MTYPTRTRALHPRLGFIPAGPAPMARHMGVLNGHDLFWSPDGTFAVHQDTGQIVYPDDCPPATIRMEGE